MHLSTSDTHTWVVSLYISVVYVCHFERYICLCFVLIFIKGSLVYIWQYLCFVYVRIHRYGVTKYALSEICSPFVHFMIYSESCLEDKSSGNIWNFLTSLPGFDYVTILSYEYLIIYTFVCQTNRNGESREFWRLWRHFHDRHPS